MKKNKTIAYLMAATLLVGGTFLGTKALFTDKIDVAGELAISTGDVDIEVVEGNEWVLDRNGNEHYDGTTGVTGEVGTTEGTLPDGGDVDPGRNTFANNLKPGDVLSKTITIQNKGTLIANVTLGNNFGENNMRLGALKGLVTPSQLVTLDSDIDSDMYVVGPDGKFKLLPGQKAEIQLVLTVENKGGEHIESNLVAGSNGVSVDESKGYNADDIENYVVNLDDAWTLDAVQQNPNNIQ